MIEWHSRNEGRLAVGVVAFMVATLLAVVAWGGGLSASFTSSRFDGLTRESTVTEYFGDVTGANVLIDHSGENNMTYTEAFDDAAWTKSNVTATADQAIGPNGSAADLLAPAAADSYIYQDDAAAAAGETHTCAFYLRTVTGNVDLSIHVYSETHTAIRGTEAITVTPYWRRYYVQGVLVAGDTAIGCTVGGNNTWSTGENVYAVRASSQENDEWRTGPGIYHPVLAGTTKPDHDLAPTNAPTGARSHLQVAGNKGPAREFDGVDQDYRKADHASLDVWDGDHTVTILHLAGADDSDVLFSHGAYQVDGVYVQRDVANDRIDVIYNSGGSDVTAQGPAGSSIVGYYHVLQVVRSGDTVNVCMDGVCGSDFDATGEGTDPARLFYVGSYNGASSFWEGQISYFRVDAEALSVDEMAADREALLGISTNWSSVNAWDFSRSTTVYKTFGNRYESMYPMHSMDLVAANIPRVSGQGGGVLIEGDVTQLHGLTEEFQTWTQAGTCAVTANNYVAPNGTLTADELNNTGGVSADRRYVATANLGNLTDRTFTMSAWIRAATPHICTLFMYESGVAIIATEDIYVTNEWQRFYATGTAAGGGTGVISASVYPGERSVATGIAHFWGANLTETTFATSYIPNAGAATSQVTKTADDLTMDPHPAGTTNWVLPEVFAADTVADKLTIYLEAKCAFSSSTDIGTSRSLLEVGGNTGSTNSMRNRLLVYVNSTGRIYGVVSDNDSMQHQAYTTAADPVDFSAWFSVRFVVDFMDLSRMDLWVSQIYVGPEDNSANTYTGNSGGVTFQTTDTKIRVGQEYNGTPEAFCRIRNELVVPQEIRAP